MEGPVPDAATESAAARQQPRRVLVFGWGAAAAEVLRELAAYAGRGAAVVHCVSHVSQAADCDLREVSAQHGFGCDLLDDNTEIHAVASRFRPDLMLSASYRKRIPGCILDVCRDRINFHPSLLPKHRGCWSGFWAIFEGDEETGVTCHHMVQEFDAGRILHQDRIQVESTDTAVSLYRKLLPVTATCAKRVLVDYFAGGLPVGDEQSGPSSYHYRRLPFGGLIQPEWSDLQVDRFVRAMHFPPFEGAALQLAPGGERIVVDTMEEFVSLRERATAVAAGPLAAAVVVAAEHSAVAAAAAATVPAVTTAPSPGVRPTAVKHALPSAG